MRFLRSDSSIFTNQYGLTEWGSYSSNFWRTSSNLMFEGLIRQFFDEQTRIPYSKSDSSIFWRTKKIIEPKIRVRQRIDGFFRWLTNRPEKWSRGLIRQNSHWQISEISIKVKFFVTKLTKLSDKTRRAEQKSFSELPPGGPLEFSRNSQSLKNGCFWLKLLSNWGSNQTMHGAAE